MKLFARIVNHKYGRVYLVEVPTNDPAEAQAKIAGMFEEGGDQWQNLTFEGIVQGDPGSGVCPGCGENHDRPSGDDPDWPNIGANVLYTLTLALALIYVIRKLGDR